jgi:hypothetical protein
VDNVDEHFDAHLTSKEFTRGHIGATEASVYRRPDWQRSDPSWHQSSSRFRVDRKEAFQQLLDANQGRSSSLRAPPSRSVRSRDQNIFTRNLPGPDTNLSNEAAPTFDRFFGAQNRIWHTHVGEPEPIWDFICGIRCSGHAIHVHGYAADPPENRDVSP